MHVIIVGQFLHLRSISNINQLFLPLFPITNVIQKLTYPRENPLCPTKEAARPKTQDQQNALSYAKFPLILPGPVPTH